MLVYSSFKNGDPYYLISGKWEFCKMLQLIDCFNLATLFGSTFSDTFVTLAISSTLFCQIYGLQYSSKERYKPLARCELCCRLCDSLHVLCDSSVVDPGEWPRWPGPPTLISRRNWGPKGRKKFFWRPGPPVISRPGSATVPVVRYAINIAHHGIKTVSIMARILERFQESVVKLYQN